MLRLVIVAALGWMTAAPWASNADRRSYPSFPYKIASTHELPPHRRTIPLEGVRPGFNQLRLTLTVSPTGQVMDVRASGDPDCMELWPQVQPEVREWKFAPFERNGKAVTAEAEEYIDLVPPERFPKIHVAPPVLRADSKIAITLERSGCYGTCPAYTVTVNNGQVVFDGRRFVIASGKHVQKAETGAVQRLARKFIVADFYSMDESYRAAVTDNPTYVLSIDIDGQKKRVVDYVGEWEGMPAVVKELEDAVDAFAGSERWIGGADGLVGALRAEKFDFSSIEAQTILKQAAAAGRAATVQQLVEAGVPLKPLPVARREDQPYGASRGWLEAASSSPETLKLLIDVGASHDDQGDKDLALCGAARSGDLEAVRALIGYGANPNGDLSKRVVSRNDGAAPPQEQGHRSVLVCAAESGNPEIVKEILRYRPNLEERDRNGRTALFAAVESGGSDEEGARAECLRLLVKAGADVNARDKDGNTALHETFLTDMAQELLKLGADVNARNDEGETPIFTTLDDDAIALFIAHGADLTIRNNQGETVTEAAKQKGPSRQAALAKAMQNTGQR